jgi:Carbohydrate-selective porin, OprB family/S-layer homology domain
MSKFSKLSLSSVLFVSAVAASSVIAGAANAQTTETVNESAMIRSIGKDPMVGRTAQNVEAQPAQPAQQAQNVTSVSQLSDVKPTDWAFTALQSLVERYGCIAGYPDKTYRGQRAMTRYEFAAGLNACLDKINEIITAGLADKVSKEDLAAVQKLQEEFAAELAALRGRVDSLEAKTAQLEAQQFSTTTKLNATAIIAPSFATNSNVTLSGRVRLNFDTSFTGKDLLRTRLQAGNVTRFDRVPGILSSSSTGTSAVGRLGFDTNTDNQFELDKLFYRFPVSSNITAYVGTRGVDWDVVFDPINPYLADSDNGAISRFGRYDPLIFRAPQGAGAALNFKFSEQFGLNLAYLANQDNAGSATGQGGLTNGGYGAGAQIVFSPVKDLKVGLAYVRSFEPGLNLTGTGSLVDVSGSTGSRNSRQPFGAVDTSTDRYGLQLSWKVAKGFAFGGWAGFANSRQESGIGRNNSDSFNWAVNLAFPDLLGEGNVAAIIFGQPPKLTSNSIATRRDDGSTTYHLEALYRWRLSKNISITPGVFFVFNPENSSANNTVVVGTIRTTFSF